MRLHRLAAFSLGFTFALAPTVRAQAPSAETPRVTNAKLETRTVSGSLAAEFRLLVERQAGPAWIGYAVPQIPGEHSMCCGNYDDSHSGCGGCRLEARDAGANTTSGEKQTVKLEGSRNIVVLFRAEKGAVGKIRAFSEDCALDAGGLPFVWLTGVNAAESVALLEPFVSRWENDSHDDHETRHAALMVIAMQDGEASSQALERFTAPDRPEKLREQTAFWLGAARGAAGLPLLTRLAKNDPSSHVRGHVAFALSVSKEPGALDEMIRMAKTDAAGYVRGQALFWLAQKAGKKAAGTITAAIQDDPDTDVKKKAVFALSQLPKDDGVPKLIEVARTNRNPTVRKQAMFWLGQSNDPRALAFFEEVLTH